VEVSASARAIKPEGDLAWQTKEPSDRDLARRSGPLGVVVVVVVVAVVEN
jgi:hypothetical protein